VEFDHVIDKLEHRWSKWTDPVYNFLGDIVAGRAALKGFDGVGFSLRRLFRQEVARALPGYPEFEHGGRDYLRLIPNPPERHCKLEAARVPVLIVYGADDPVAPAQPIADLMTAVGNPNVAALVLPGGGHCGFAPYARRYFYSLVVNYFDRQHGAAAALQRGQSRYAYNGSAAHAAAQ
jgi:pimeloyl-ACP methyl ester carboxylesterase